MARGAFESLSPSCTFQGDTALYYILPFENHSRISCQKYVKKLSTENRNLRFLLKWFRKKDDSSWSVWVSLVHAYANQKVGWMTGCVRYLRREGLLFIPQWLQINPNGTWPVFLAWDSSKHWKKLSLGLMDSLNVPPPPGVYSYHILWSR